MTSPLSSSRNPLPIPRLPPRGPASSALKAPSGPAVSATAAAQVLAPASQSVGLKNLDAYLAQPFGTITLQNWLERYVRGEDYYLIDIRSKGEADVGTIHLSRRDGERRSFSVPLDLINFNQADAEDSGYATEADLESWLLQLTWKPEEPVAIVCRTKSRVDLLSQILKSRPELAGRGWIAVTDDQASSLKSPKFNRRKVFLPFHLDAEPTDANQYDIKGWFKKIEALSLKPGVPVIVVCRTRNRSESVAKQGREEFPGQEWISLSDGMEKSLLYGPRLAEQFPEGIVRPFFQRGKLFYARYPSLRARPRGDLEIRQIKEEGFAGTTTHLFVTSDNRVTIVDPTRADVPRIRRVLKGYDTDRRRPLRVDSILLTHPHIDHLTAAGDIQREYGYRPQIVVGAKSGYRGADRYLKDGEHYYFGGGVFGEKDSGEGHSREDSIFKIFTGVETGFPNIAAVLTGDLIGKDFIGRTDNPKLGIPKENARREVRAIHDKIFPLPGLTFLFSSHSEVTTVAREKDRNPFVGRQRSVEQAAIVRAAKKLALPTRYREAVAFNAASLGSSEPEARQEALRDFLRTTFPADVFPQGVAGTDFEFLQYFNVGHSNTLASSYRAALEEALRLVDRLISQDYQHRGVSLDPRFIPEARYQFLADYVRGRELWDVESLLALLREDVAGDFDPKVRAEVARLHEAFSKFLFGPEEGDRAAAWNFIVAIRDYWLVKNIPVATRNAVPELSKRVESVLEDFRDLGLTPISTRDFFHAIRRAAAAYPLGAVKKKNAGGEDDFFSSTFYPEER